MREDRDEGLFLRLDKLIQTDTEGQRSPLNVLSTAQVFTAATSLVDKIGKQDFSNKKPQSIGTALNADMFYFKRNILEVDESSRHLEHNLIRYMPQIITSPSPMLMAAQINSQIEFDRTFRTLVKEHAYRGKKVLFISGLHIDISPQAGQLFPLTKFIPWAASLLEQDGSFSTLEQSELAQVLEQQSTDNPHQIDLEAAIKVMTEAEEIKVKLNT